MPISMHRSDKYQESDQILLQEFEHFLSGKAEGTIDAYLRTVRHVMEWVSDRPGNSGHFQPHQQGVRPQPLSRSRLGRSFLLD